MDEDGGYTCIADTLSRRGIIRVRHHKNHIKRRRISPIISLCGLYWILRNRRPSHFTRSTKNVPGRITFGSINCDG